MKTVGTILARAVLLFLPGARPRRTRTVGTQFAAKTCMAFTLLAGVLQGVFLAAPGSADSGIGSWGPRFRLPLIAIHAAPLSNGKVDRFLREATPLRVLRASTPLGETPGCGTGDREPHGRQRDVFVRYDVRRDTVRSDGQVFVAGGRIHAEMTAIFNPATETWNPGPHAALALLSDRHRASRWESVHLFRTKRHRGVL